jgi:hypothetical protein
MEQNNHEGIDELSIAASSAAPKRRRVSHNRSSTVSDRPPLTSAEMYSYDGDQALLYKSISDTERQCLRCGAFVMLTHGRDWNWLVHLGRNHPFMLTRTARDTVWANLYKKKSEAPLSASSDAADLSPAAAALEDAIAEVKDSRRPASGKALITGYMTPAAHQVDLAAAFAQLSLEGGLALRLAETTAMRRFVKNIVGPASKLTFPSHVTVARVAERIADGWIDKVRQQLESDLAPIDQTLVKLAGMRGKLALAGDAWTDHNMRAFLCVSAHWRSKATGKLVRAPLALAELHSPHTT